jgi:Chlorite dismutase
MRVQAPCSRDLQPLPPRAAGDDGRAHRRYGIDDQDAVVAFDSPYPQEFVDPVERLHYTEASLFTQRDTPIFTGASRPLTRSSHSWRTVD